MLELGMLYFYPEYLHNYTTAYNCALHCNIVLAFLTNSINQVKHWIMGTKNVSKSKASKFLLGMIIVLGAISLAKFGYMFGQWLYQQIH